MNIQGIFIGINKHQDPKIGELNGAVRDATALWALFADTIPNLSGRLATNEKATNNNVRNHLFGTLSAASADDVVIISFAGHGSSDGRLIMYDTLGTNLPGTAISMTELASAFKETKARAVLLILDCCFSGQAPGRIFEVEATPRNPFIYSDIYGEGRILLAACESNEVAYEQPGTGHGLLTYAVIQAFQGEPGTNIQFPDVAGDVIRLAKIEGQRIGVTQTPVFLGTVSGGLAIPSLRRGDNFYATFPTIPTRTYSGPFSELADCGIPQAVIVQWSAKFPNGLNALQLKAINEYGILAGNSLLIVAPTSSGKTMIGELASIQSVLGGRKAAFLLPYRALVNEKYEQFKELYESSGIRVIRCSGDASDGIGPALAGRYDIGFFTYETFLNMALNSQKLLNQLGTIILDEGQFITDPNRGITVELIFSLLLRSRHAGINPQLLVLSAVIGNLNNFDKWLNVSVLFSKERPIPLIEGVLDRHGVFQFVDVDGSSKQEQFLPRSAIIQRRKEPSMQDIIVPLAKKLVAVSEKLIVFRNVRGSAQGCAKYLAEELGLPPATTVLNALPNQDLSTTSRDLRDALRGGTAFHNTNLLKPEREAVEKAFRKPNGEISVLAATTTLAAGINTPASTVILAENEFIGEDGRPFTVAEYKNMAGRAGRLGYNEKGKAIILAETPFERAQLFQKYVLGTPEDVKSSFQNGQLPTWILRLLSHVRGVRMDDVPALLVNTFGGYSNSLQNPNWHVTIQAEIRQLLNRMITLNLAILEGDILHLTLLGKACATSSLKFESALRLVEMMNSIDITNTPPTHVLGIVQVLAEADDIYTPVMRRGRTEAARLNDVSIRYGRQMILTLQRYTYEEITHWQRCKRAAILWDWIHGNSVESLERHYTANPFTGVVSYGDITRITDGTRYHLRSAHQILTALFPENSEFLLGLDNIIKQLEFGLPIDALPLLDIQVPLIRGQYLSLYNSGAKTPADVFGLPKSTLIECVGILAAALIPSNDDKPQENEIESKSQPT